MDGNVNALHPGNPINDQDPRVSKRHSTFDLSSALFSTERFGDITPMFVTNTNPNETFPFGCSSDVRTLNLKAPLMGKISKKQDYFAVPMETILPFNWDKIYDNPNIGDDVPDDAYTSVPNFWKKINDKILVYLAQSCMDGLYQDDMEDYVLDDLNILSNWALKFFILGEYFFSSGSLLNYLGIDTTTRFQYSNASDQRVSFDRWFDSFIVELKKFDTPWIVDIDSVQYVISDDPTSVAFGDLSISWRELLQLERDNGCIYAISNFTVVGNGWNDLNDFFDEMINGNWTVIDNGLPVDLARVFAYQIVCSHFYTNDKVDYIYSAELFRQLISSYVRPALKSAGEETFSYNGVDIPYDWCSAAGFIYLLTEDNVLDDPNIPGYLSTVFGYRSSLRFVDYFTGSKTRPLAVGDTSVDVNTGDNTVSVIDITKNIQMQRFLNAVNRSGRKFSNYIKSLFDVNIGYDWHDPMYLAHTSDDVYGSEVENTGDSMMSDAQTVRTTLKSNSSRFVFEFFSERPCILIGVSYYDISRVYFKATERQTMIADRFDMFNPMLEFVGDQPIYLGEINGGVNIGNAPFGYTTRYMEYKQSIPRAVGGFVENLPGFVFLADNYNSDYTSKISPSYIRSKNVELDSFFNVLTGYSLGSYWHFICGNFRKLDNTKRPMSHNPQIL